MTGGETVDRDISNTDAENIVGAAVGLGLIAADAPLTIGADGTITKADDIPIEKLNQIIEAIKSGTYDFSSVEDYLSLISTLVGNGNLTENEQKRILDNISTSLGVLDGISADVGTSAKDLTAIREAIESLTKEYEWEAEDEDTDDEISWITAEHTGFLDYPLLEMTGQGCREFETYSEFGFEHFFDLVKEDSEKFHMSRLDVSFDDFSGIFDIQKMVGDYFFGNWVSSSFKGKIEIKVEQDKDRIIHGFSLMTGTKSSDMYMRIYDKANERGFRDGRHWIRCKLVLKQDHATSFIKNPAPLGEKFRGVILKYFRFLTPSKTDSNKRRWKMRKYWADFLGAVEPISVFIPKNIDYNLHRLHHYVMEQAGNSVETYIRCVGLYDFFERLKDRGTKGLTPQQRFLVDKCDRMEREKKRLTLKELEEILDSFGVSIDHTAPEEEQTADQTAPDETVAAAEPVPESSSAEQLTAEADPFASIPIPEPPKGWFDDS